MLLAEAVPIPAYPEGPEALKLAQAGLAAFDRMAEHWGLSVEQQRVLLGGVPKTTYYALLKGSAASVGRDLLERLSLLMGIWSHLEILIPDPKAAGNWMRRPHPDRRFGGSSPLDWMLQGTVTALADTRRYLEAWRFGW